MELNWGFGDQRAGVMLAINTATRSGHQHLSANNSNNYNTP